MTTITGTFKDSGQVPLASGVLRVQLNAPLADADTTPDSYLVTLAHEFAITNGVLATCNLKESQTQQISYTFSVFQTFTDYDYYYSGSGEFYGRNTDRPTHLHTDSKYYSGVSHVADSLPLERIARTRLEPIGDAFQAIVPNQPTVEFANLERTGFATDRTPQTARQVATVLTQDPLFMQSLIDFLVVQPYDNTKPYRRGNIVAVAGSSYQCLVDNAVGFPPATSPTQWRLLASKGDPGGTGGNDVPYNAAIWDGQSWAPTANVLRDYIELSLATASQLANYAPLNSPNLTGSPSRDVAPNAGDRTSQLATTQWVGSEFAPLNNAGLTGNPTVTTPALTSNSDRIPTTNWVRSIAGRTLVIATRSVNQSLTINVIGVAIWDSENHDSLNAYNPATGVFTVPSTDWYEFAVNIYVMITGATGCRILTTLFVNGAEFLRLSDVGTDSQNFQVLSVTGRALLTQAQTVDIRIYPLALGGTPTAAAITVAAGFINRLTISRVIL